MKIKEFVKKNKLSICFILLIIGITLFINMFVFRDNDYFWHITAGEYMARHGILTHDVFSWSVVGKYWMSHEWLFELILYGFKSIFGSIHILIYSFVCILSLLLILFFSRKKEYLKNPLFGIIWVCASIILMYYAQGRPQLLSYILLALIIWFCMDLYNNKESKKIYFIPLISILWANIHGGSSNLSYLFCFIFFIVGLFNIDIGKIKSNRLSKKQLRKYLIVGIISILCISINIHGFKMITYPYENMANTLMINTISEWRPTSLSDINHYPYLILLVLILFIFLFSKKKINLIDLVLFGICVFLGLKSIRFWPFTYIIMSYVVFNYIDRRKLDKGTESLMIIISLIIAVMFILRLDNIDKRLNQKYLSNELVNVIKREKPNRLFNMYDYGGELIYHNINVFIDGRADLYGKYNYKDYLKIVYLNKNIDNLLDKYNFDYLIIDTSYPIYTYLNNNAMYSSVFTSKKYVIYKKN